MVTAMSALKSIVLIISLFSLAFALEATKGLRVTKTWSNEVKDFPYLSKVDNHIVTVSIKENDTVQITFLAEMKKTPCQIRLEIPEKKVLDPQIFARELGNGKIVMTTELITLAKDDSHESNFFIVVDPSECTAKKIEIPGTNDFPLYLIFPVAFDEIFDVFPNFMVYNDTQVKTIKRYTEDGKEIIVPDSISSDVNLTNHQLTYVYPMNSKDPSDGYLLVTNSKEGVTLTLLNSKLELTKQNQRKDVHVNTVSTSFNSVTICYVKQEQSVCEFLDKDLNTRLEIPMMKDPEGHAYNSWAANLPDGGAMVIVQHAINKKEENPPQRIELSHIQRIFKDGSTSDPVELGRNVNSWCQLRGFVMDNDEYCAGIVATKSDSENPGKVSAFNGVCVDTKSE